MITRYIFTGYHICDEMKPKDNPDVSQLSFFTYDDKIFMYFESEKDNIDPDSVATENLKEFPDGKHWMRMADIFHYSKPKSSAHWERKLPDKKPVMRLIYLKDDKVSSYVFYHYRYQEEFPGDGNKYGLIAALGNMLAFYSELPCEFDSEIEGSFKTSETMHLDWSGLMDEHFRREPGETEGTWKLMKKL